MGNSIYGYLKFTGTPANLAKVHDDLVQEELYRTLGLSDPHFHSVNYEENSVFFNYEEYAKNRICAATYHLDLKDGYSEEICKKISEDNRLVVLESFYQYVPSIGHTVTKKWLNGELTHSLRDPDESYFWEPMLEDLSFPKDSLTHKEVSSQMKGILFQASNQMQAQINSLAESVSDDDFEAFNKSIKSNIQEFYSNCIKSLVDKKNAKFNLSIDLDEFNKEENLSPF